MQDMTRFGMKTVDLFDRFWKHREHFAVYNSRMTIIANQIYGAIVYESIKILSGDKALLCHAVAGNAVTGKDFGFLIFCRKISDHPSDFFEIAGFPYVEKNGSEKSPVREMQVSVAEGGQQRPVSELDPVSLPGKFCRKLVPHMEDTAVVFDQVFEHLIVPVAGHDIAVKDFHELQHMPAEMPGQAKE
jgi:hypothetical protein